MAVEDFFTFATPFGGNALAKTPHAAAVMHVLLLLGTLVFAAVVVALGVSGVTSDESVESSWNPLVLGVMTAVHFGLGGVLLVLASKVPGFLLRRKAQALAGRGADDDQVADAATAFFCNVVVGRALAFEAVASTGLIVCLLAVLNRGPWAFHLNALTTGAYVLYAIVAFPSAGARKEMIDRLAKLVREQREAMGK